MKTFTIIFLLLLTTANISAQSEEYAVNATVMNVRSGPGTEHAIILKLEKGDLVDVLSKSDSEWWKIRYNQTTGYASAKLLRRGPYADWEKKSYSSGETPDCENISPAYDWSINNYLKIEVGNNADVVVKLMKKSSYSDRCVRVVYINSGDTYSIRNIPEGQYYLKIAYGSDYRQTFKDGRCIIKFIKGALYKRGDNILDYNIIETSYGQEIPSYELFLDVVYTYGGKNFDSDQISESEFNE